MTGRRPWAADRRHTVTIGSRWMPPDADTMEPGPWRVSRLWEYEQGNGRLVLAVTLTCHGGGTRHMSQARLLNTMREVDE